MPRQKCKTVYKFSELTDKAKDKAVGKLYDLNVHYEWWDGVYEDAKMASLKITEFDIDRGSYAKGHFLKTPADTAQYIVANHGKVCETFKTASTFLEELARLEDAWLKERKDAEDKENEDELDAKKEELGEEFLKSLLEDYRLTLRNEYEYQTSREQIVESIEANEYEFDENGNLE